jgi:hypothetical protein
MAKNSGDLKAARAFDVHKETIGALYKALELVGSGLMFGGGVEEIDGHLDEGVDKRYVNLGKERSRRLDVNIYKLKTAAANTTAGE